VLGAGGVACSGKVALDIEGVRLSGEGGGGQADAQRDRDR
jgi:hypothetical protein